MTIGKTITAKKYQHAAGEFAVYPKSFAVEYLSLGLASEAGEVAGKTKKMIRGDYTEVADQPDASGKTPMRVNIKAYEEDLHAEMGDVLWYLARLADETGTTLEHIMASNIKKLQARQKADSIKGSGDSR